MDGRVDGQAGGRMNRRADGQAGGWMDERAGGGLLVLEKLLSPIFKEK
jgi:hypothetical protein